MNKLLTKWSEIQKEPRQSMETVGSVQERVSEELQVLEALRAAGWSQIPGEAFDVQFLIQDRHRLLREMRDRIS
jgi:hypothetical protein